MKRGLLLTAFIATLILDMGAGPVFIVYGSINLSKSATFPSAPWLLIRGILNCVQFITVMWISWIINNSRSKYSRKEEAIIMAHLMTTHPVIFFYYFMLLSGLIWNILGSCWIGTAFHDYPTGFGVCYLVSVILSWLSTILSPFFVLLGSLSKRKINHRQEVDATNGDTLLINTKEETDLVTILDMFKTDTYSISMNDILARQEPKNTTVKTAKIPQFLSPEERPIAVKGIDMTGIEQNHEDLLLDGLKSHEKEEDGGIVFLQRDVLDEDEATEMSAWANTTDDMQCEAVTVDKIVNVAVATHSEEINEKRDIPHETPIIKVDKPIESKEEIGFNESVPSEHENNRKSKRKEKKLLTKPRSVKGNVVIVESEIPERPKNEKGSGGKESCEFSRLAASETEDNYIDVSFQMRNNMNNGMFDTTVHDDNVDVIYIG